MWSEAKRRAFDDEGFVRLEGALAPAAVDAMAELLWSELARTHGVREDAQETWVGARLLSGFQAINKSEVFAATGSAAVREACEQLLGPCKILPFANPLVTLAGDTSGRSVPSAGWHLDLPVQSLDRLPGLRVFSYLADVPHGGGATAVVAGSHRLVTQLARSAQAEGKGDGAPLPSRRVRETLRRRHDWIRDLFQPGDEVDDDARVRRFIEEGSVVEGIPLRVHELSAARGDVILMDLRVLHAASPNRSPRPRLVLGQIAVPAPR